MRPNQSLNDLPSSTSRQAVRSGFRLKVQQNEPGMAAEWHSHPLVLLYILAIARLPWFDHEPNALG